MIFENSLINIFRDQLNWNSGQGSGGTLSTNTDRNRIYYQCFHEISKCHVYFVIYEKFNFSEHYERKIFLPFLMLCLISCNKMIFLFLLVSFILPHLWMIRPCFLTCGFIFGNYQKSMKSSF